ncbi:MAG: dimethlysulfonioproprionate lyase DddL [Desulfonatronovibrio sp. MSAO_Bac4]|nr:MAG: dimethlysulfonioproprionate lyase DddL [Desulfonatronovibrio sp. MSAO_Bac4]
MRCDRNITTNQRLSDKADLLYLLRDVDEVYRRSSAGGSKMIRSHQHQVRKRLSRVIEADEPLIDRTPEDKPVTIHLPRALEIGNRGPLTQMAQTIGRITSVLTWAYGYDKISSRLAKRYAFAEIAGPSGPVRAQTLIIGLVLFAPGTVYPQHAHQEIEESYISVAGAWSENDAAVYAPGSLILNRSGDQHRITVGDREPCLLVYAWLGEKERLLKPNMTFSRSFR